MVNTLYNLTGSVRDTGNGITSFTALYNIGIPPGANIYINVIESNATNTNSFSGSYHLQNYRP